ncbi:MAG TPA: hypothetical protein VFS07_09770 [Gemmatimonadales bacterium]|nr:hypothetical protein [Gemmatimonadales bacterium]
MLVSFPLLLHLLAGPAPAVPSLPHPRAHGGDVRVTIDSSAYTITLAAGPFAIPAGHPEMGHAAMHEHTAEVPLLYFKWPMTAYLRGFRLELTDSAGRPLPRRLLHHLNLVNFGRRQLFYAVPERTLAVGQETPDIMLPKTVGIPVEAEWPMALVLAWHNETAEPIPAVNVTLVLSWSPTTLTPRPTPVLPVYMDVVDPVAKPVTFDLPPGRSRYEADFTLPTSGRIIGIGGHAHDYATGIALEELRPDGRPRIVTRLRTTLDSAGRLLGIEQKLPGIRSAGIPLTAGRRYRIVGTYDNPNPDTLRAGAMIHVVFLYAVTDPAKWPAVDPEDRDWQREVAWLDDRGSGYGGEMDHDGMGHTH